MTGVEEKAISLTPNEGGPDFGAPKGRHEIARGVNPWKESAERSESCKGGREKKFRRFAESNVHSN